MKPTTSLFDRRLPKSAPDLAAPTPSAVNRTAIPRTNAAESAAPCARDLASCAPNTLTVMPIIGQTHGVALVASPLANAMPAATKGPLPASAAENLSAADPPLFRGEGGQRGQQGRGEHGEGPQGAMRAGGHVRAPGSRGSATV